MFEPIDGPWKGRNKIILSIDIGLTHSGVSFAYLESGVKPALHTVTHWPGQEGNNLREMVPTVVWYDRENKAVAFGAEAASHNVEEQAKDKGWSLAKGFKAHLYPEYIPTQGNQRFNALPFGVPLTQIYTDFLEYLLKHTKKYFGDHMIEGTQIWDTYKSTMEMVMSHPDGWEGREQSFLREAAVRAGFTTSRMAPDTVRFLTDTKASAYYYLYNTNIIGKLQIGEVFLLCDVGDIATDICLHRVDSISPVLKLSTCDSRYLETGSASVDAAAEKYMRQTMADAGIPPEDLNEFTRVGTRSFKTHVKFAPNKENEDHLVEISNPRYNNSALKTRRGHMALPGTVVRSFFGHLIESIYQGIDRLEAGTTANIPRIMLVGCFGDSSYLAQTIKEKYEARGCSIIVSASNGAFRSVLDGALIWDVSVGNGYRSSRSLGIETHFGRWLEITAKGDLIRPGAEIKKFVSLKYPTPTPELDEFELKFLTCTKEVEVTHTRDKKGVLLDGFHKWFTLSANLSTMNEALVQRFDANNVIHWRLNFDVCIRFGEKGLDAYLEWSEKGAMRISSVTIRPDYEF